jgi:hypothetical protein
VGIAFPIVTAEIHTGRVDDVSVYASIDDMEGSLEEIDVQNHEYTAWDATGVLLTLDVDPALPKPHWLKVASTGQDDRERLLVTIREYARGGWAEIDPTEWPPDLLAEVRKASE